MDAKNYEMTAEYEISEQVSQIEEDTKSLFVYLFVKRMLDLICSLLAIVVFSPFFLIVAVAIRLTSEGPAIYKHKRIGYHGRTIGIYKFRSMVVDADNFNKYLSVQQLYEFGKNYKLDNDPRVTRIGRTLRKVSLDELPQLFNIFKGEMSLVGPRPILNDELVKYGLYRDAYMSVKPGLTGMWQVNGRSCTTYEDRVLLDVKYINSRSVSGDLKLIFQTVGTVLSRKGAC